MSLKEHGNQFFRNGDYQNAIRCYEEYLESDPQADRLAGNCNLSLALFKAGRLQESIEAADDALAEDSTCKKAYYRKIQAFKCLPGSDYQIFINIQRYLKYTTDERELHDYKAQLADHKLQWLATLNNKSPPVDCSLFESIEPAYSSQELTVEDWTQQWASQQPETAFKHLEAEAKKDSQQGANLVYLFLNNQDPSSPQFASLKARGQELVCSLSSQMEVEEEASSELIQPVQAPVSKQSDSSDENLFASEQSSSVHQDQQSLPAQEERQTETMQPERSRTDLKTEAQSEPKAAQIFQEKTEEKSETKRQSQGEQMEVEKNGEVASSEPMESEGEDLTGLLEEFTKPLKVGSRDNIGDLLKVVESILSAGVPVSAKRRLLQMLKQRHEAMVRLMKKSFSKKEQQPVKDLLVATGLLQFIPDFASKHAS